jgi:LuxR family transcriptional regulator, maltose regulon positive regulatory protein
VRDFLVKTSILDHLTGELCDALTGRDDGQAMLERLEMDNLFVVALDDERRWYRFHHLFAEFLRGRLGRESSGRVGELHLAASDWFERNGWPSEAVGHALAANDHERAVGGTWLRGDVLTLLGWLERLPVESKRRRPRLLLEHATTLMVVGRLDSVEPLLREAERAASREGSVEDSQVGADEIHSRYMLGYASAIRAWRVNLLEDSQAAIELARRALDLLTDDPAPRSFAAFSLGAAYRDAGDLEVASAAFAEAAELSRAAGHDHVALGAMRHHARAQMERGRLREADSILRRALRLAAERGGASPPATGEVHVALGELRYERNDLDSAEERLTEGVELAGRTGKFDTLVDGYVALSRAERARGDAEGALETAREAERLARIAGVGQVIVEATAWKARLHLAEGDLAAAAFEQERTAGGGSVAAQETERTTLARLLVARGEHDEALRLLHRLREAAEEAGRAGSTIEILALEALASWATDEKERAVNVLSRALSLAEPEGYVRTFVDEGPPMSALLSEVLEAQQRRRLVAFFFLLRILWGLVSHCSSLRPVLAFS